MHSCVLPPFFIVLIGACSSRGMSREIQKSNLPGDSAEYHASAKEPMSEFPIAWYSLKNTMDTCC